MSCKTLLLLLLLLLLLHLLRHMHVLQDSVVAAAVLLLLCNLLPLHTLVLGSRCDSMGDHSSKYAEAC